MRYLELFENLDAFTVPELNAMKSVIAGKIKLLPADDATAKTLREIEELLQHVNAGGRMGMIKGRLQKINDPAVMASQKKLAQYLASMEVEPKDREELFSLWADDKLVNIDKLLSKNAHTFGDIFNGYDTNPAIKELVDDVMEEQALGQGKGEFGLNVLSKSVSKPGNFVQNQTTDVDGDGDKEEAKGDLLVKLDNKWIKVEVKTTHGGAARFSDQEVRPAEGYEAAATALNRFVVGFSNQSWFKQLFPKGVPAYGVNMNKAMEMYKLMKDGEYGEKLLSQVQNLVTLIFGGKKADQKMVKTIMSNFKAGNANEVLQLYSQASFNYYMSKKDDAGVLGINLNSKSFIFYSDAGDLKKAKMRLNTDTIYLSAKDANRGAYPQLSVIPTTFGANAKAKAEKDAQKQAIKTAKANPVDVPDITGVKKQQIEAKVYEFVTNVATSKGIFDQDAIDAATMQAVDLIVQGVPTAKIKSTINSLLTQSKAAAEVPAEPVEPVAEPIQPTAPVQPTAPTKPQFPTPRPGG
jgi:hypothetical protein